MLTQRRSTPPWAKIACCAAPVRPAAQVCVEIGTPAAFWARAAARRMFSMTGVTAAVPVPHLMWAHRQPRGVGGAVDDARLPPARAYALGDVADEEIGDRVDAVRAEVALRHPPHARGHNHVHPAAGRGGGGTNHGTGRDQQGA